MVNCICINKNKKLVHINFFHSSAQQGVCLWVVCKFPNMQALRSASWHFSVVPVVPERKACPLQPGASLRGSRVARTVSLSPPPDFFFPPDLSQQLPSKPSSSASRALILKPPSLFYEEPDKEPAYYALHFNRATDHFIRFAVSEWVMPRYRGFYLKQTDREQPVILVSKDSSLEFPQAQPSLTFA